MSATPNTIPNASKAASELQVSPPASNRGEEIENLSGNDFFDGIQQRLAEIESGRLELRSGVETNPSPIQIPNPSAGNIESDREESQVSLLEERLKVVEEELELAKKVHADRYGAIIGSFIYFYVSFFSICCFHPFPGWHCCL